jgi:threonine synthase
MELSNVDGIYGVVLLPAEGTSEVQKLQMISNKAPNVMVMQVDGDFDFCQQFVKKFLLKEADTFAAEYFMLLTVANSISWVRLAAQIAMHSNCYLESVKSGKNTFILRSRVNDRYVFYMHVFIGSGRDTFGIQFLSDFKDQSEP